MLGAPLGRLARSGQDRWLSLIVLLLLITGAFYVAYLIFSPFLTAIFLAFVLAIAFAPLHRWIAKRIRGANTAALATTVVVMLFIVVPFILVSLRLASEAASFYSATSQQWRSGTAWYNSVSGLSETLERAADHIGVPVQQLKSVVTGRAQNFGAWLLGMATWAARGALQQMVTAALVFLILFFFLRDRAEFRRGVFGLLPLPPRRLLELAAIVHESIVANIYGMFAVGLVQGILTAIGFWMTGLRAPLLWGVMAMVFSFVPLVGPSLVWIPGAAVLAMQGDIGKAALTFPLGRRCGLGRRLYYPAKSREWWTCQRKQAAGTTFIPGRSESLRRYRNFCGTRDARPYHRSLAYSPRGIRCPAGNYEISSLNRST